MSQMEAKGAIIKSCETEQNEEDDLIRVEKEQFIRAFQGYNQELAQLKQQSMCLFEDWVSSIYRFKVKKSQLQLQFEGYEIRIHPFAIEMILRKVIIEVCEVHKILIGEQMGVMLEAGVGENYFKIDAQTPEIGYFDSVNDQWEENERTRIQEGLNTHRLVVNQQYYEYCVWTIYHHYCSLSECNSEVEGLVEHLRGSMQSTAFQMYKDIEFKKLMLDEYGFLESEGLDPTITSLLSHNEDYNPGYITNLLNDYKLVREGELNILTISNLIPLAMPKLEAESDITRCELDHSSKDLYEHIGRFENTINTIFLTSKQNMRKFVNYVDDFRKAIKVLRQRLQNLLGTQKKNLTSVIKDNGNFADFFEDPMLMELADEQFDMEDFGTLKENFKCDEFILNIDRPLSKQNEKSMEINSILSKEAFAKLEREKIKMTESSFERIRTRTEKNEIIETTTGVSFKKKSVLVHNFDKSFEPSPKLQKKIIEKTSTSVKIQFVLKNNDRPESQFKGFGLEETKLKKIQSETSAHSQKEEFLEKKKIGHRDQRMVQKLKYNLNRMMKESMSQGSSLKEDLSFIGKNDKNHITKKLVCYKQENSELNLHQFLQQNEFSHDPDEEIMDEQFLEKMEKEVKKKKKKNKKKSKKRECDEQKESENQTCETENGKHDSSSLEFVLKQFGYKQYAIIKNLMEMSFELQSRQQCYKIDEEAINEMKKRQKQTFEIELKDTARPASKPKGKTKKNKNT